MLCFHHLSRRCCCSAFKAGQVCVTRVRPLHTTYSGGSQVSGVMDSSPVKQRRENSRRWRHVYLPHPSPRTPPLPPPPLYLSISSLHEHLHPRVLPEASVHQLLYSPLTGYRRPPKDRRSPPPPHSRIPSL